MFGLGTIINTVAVIVAGFLGLLLKNGIKPGVHSILMQACGVSTIFIGTSGVISKMLAITDGKIETTGTMLLIFSLVIGSFFGEIFNIEQKMDNAGKKIKQMVKKQNDTMFVDGFVNVSLIICVGAMAIFGALKDGISGDSSVLLVKSTMDSITAFILGSSLGIGVAFSGISIFLYQGAIAMLATYIQPFVTDAMMMNICTVGYAIVFVIGTNMLGLTKVKLANTLPAIVLAVIYTFLF